MSSTTATELNAPRGRSIEDRIRIAIWSVFAALLVFYAVMAFEYFFALIGGRQEWWNLFQAWVVSDAYSFGDGSVYKEQHASYSFNAYFLFVHTTLGAVALAIGPFMFLRYIRRHYLNLHRTLGKVYLFSVWLSMTSGLLHLGTVSLWDVFSGAAFGVGLWGLDLLVILTSVLAYTAIRRKDVRTHQAWMAFNYALIVATPMLRVFWLVFGLATPDLTQWTINAGVTTYLLPFCLFFGMAWYSFEYMRDRRTG